MSYNLISMHSDYLFFVHGLFLLYLSHFCGSLRLRTEGKTRWKLLALFAIPGGFEQWLEFAALNFGDSTPFFAARLLLRCVSFLFLIEFGRASTIGDKWGGRWVLLPFLLVACLGGLAGWPGLDASTGYALVLPGGVWAALALWRSDENKKGPDRSLRVAAMALLLYGLIRGVVAPSADFFPANLFNTSWFIAKLGFPVLWMTSGLAVIVGLAIWRFHRSLLLGKTFAGNAPKRMDSYGWAVLGLISLLIGGWVGTNLFGLHAEKQERAHLLDMTTVSASAVNPRRVESLSGTAKDLDNPDYLRLKEQLTFVQQALSGSEYLRAYLLIKQSHKTILVVDSNLRDARQHAAQSPIEPDASKAIDLAFETGRPSTFGPYLGSSMDTVSGLSPVRLPESGQIVGVLGFDMDAKHFADVIFNNRRKAILVTLLIVTLSLMFILYRQRTHEAKIELLESNMLSSSIIDFLPDATLVIDTQGKVIAWNRAMENMTGIKADQIIGKGNYEYSLPFYGERRPSLADLALLPQEETEKSYTGITRLGDRISAEAYLPNMKGGSRYLLGSASVLRNSQSQVTGAIETIHDITIRRTAEKALRQSQNMLQTITQSAQDAILMLDSSGNISFWNDAAERIFGLTEQETLGKNLHQLIAPERFLLAHRQAFGPFTTSGQGSAVGKTLELAALKKDKTEIPVELSLSAVQVEGQWHAVGIIRDISDRKKVEQELTLAKEKAEILNQELEFAAEKAYQMAVQADSANQAKSDFLANMSHEIRTPLNGVIGMTELLLNTGLNPEQREFTEIVRNSGKTLLAVVNDILDFSKIEAGKLDLEAIDFDLRAAVEDTVDILALRAQEKDLEFIFDIKPDVPSLLLGDPERLRQILTNLMGNAIKFTSRGEVSLQVSLEAENEKAATLRFEIQDTGIGIPEDKISSLFLPFSQADTSTSRRFGGTGLGLSISRRLVEMMGGQIGVSSQDGRGSCFWFTASFQQQKIPSVLPGEAARDLQGQRILFVDDNTTNRRLLDTLLRQWKCEAQGFSDPETAWEAIISAQRSGKPFAVAILDMHMPGMSGEELAQRMVKVPVLRETRLVMLTSMAQRGDANRLSKLGFSAYLTKPLKQEQLYRCLTSLVNREPAASGEPAEKFITQHSLNETQRRNINILLVEDNITNQKVALAILGKLGYRADVAANGQEALKRLKTAAYDLVLMDCQMPEMDGYEASRVIRDPASQVRNHQIPIIAMTAHALKGDREKCLQAGMNDYVSKPIQAKELGAAIGRWLTHDRDSSLIHAVDPTPDEAAVFDRALLVTRLMGDEELARSIIAAFLQDIPQQMAKLHEALQQSDIEAVRRQAHTIKGAAANVNAMELRQVARKLEETAAAGDLKAASRLMSSLNQSFDKLRQVANPTKREPA